MQTLLQIPGLDINLPNMFCLTPIFYAVSSSRSHEVINLLMKGGADPSIEASFTMRNTIVDTASAILQAVVKGRTAILNIFFDYAYMPKRKWFINRGHNSIARQAAENISRRVPTLKSITRKTIKSSLSRVTKIPNRAAVKTLGLPRTLIDYIAYQ